MYSWVMTAPSSAELADAGRSGLQQQIAVISCGPFWCTLAVLAALLWHGMGWYRCGLLAFASRQSAPGSCLPMGPRRPPSSAPPTRPYGTYQYWCHVHPRGLPHTADYWEAAKSGERQAWYSAAHRQPIHAATHDLNCCPKLAAVSRVCTVLSPSPPEPQIVGRQERWPCEMGLQSGRLYACNAACAESITRHGRHSLARNRCAAPEPNIVRGHPPSVWYACEPGTESNGVPTSLHIHRVDCRGRGLPNHYHICKLRDAVRASDTSRGRVRASTEHSSLRKPHH